MLCSNYLIRNHFYNKRVKAQLRSTLYRPRISNFSKSNAWDFRLINTGISENVPVGSEDFWRFSEHFQTFPKMSEDVETTFEHFRSYLEDENFRLFWFRWDAKSSFDAFLEHFLGNWIFVKSCIKETICPDLWVRREKLSLMREIDVFIQRPWDSRIMGESWQVYN